MTIIDVFLVLPMPRSDSGPGAAGCCAGGQIRAARAARARGNLADCFHFPGFMAYLHGIIYVYAYKYTIYIYIHDI